MNLATLITVNGILSLAVVAAVFAIVCLTHRLHEEAEPETLHPSQPIPLHVFLPAAESGQLSKAA